jgi:large subunit ribosomal protein L15
MLSNEITQIAGKYKKAKRVGRGKGTGNGKTCGRGHKGAKSRSGAKLKKSFEGGQMPLFRRIPKRGFNNARFMTSYEIVNVSELERVFDDGSSVAVAELAGAGLVDSTRSRVKILGDGQLTKKLEVSAHKFSKSAQEKINGCGGSTKIVA